MCGCKCCKDLSQVALIGMPVAGVVVASVALSTAPAQWASGSQRQAQRPGAFLHSVATHVLNRRNLCRLLIQCCCLEMLEAIKLQILELA